MLFFALCQADFQFDVAALVMHVQRHDGVARALHFSDEFVDFVLVHQQLAGADRIGVDVGRGVEQGADVGTEQVERAVHDGDVSLLELGAPGADGFDFPTLQHDASFMFFFNEVLVVGLFILNDAHVKMCFA